MCVWKSLIVIDLKTHQQYNASMQSKMHHYKNEPMLIQSETNDALNKLRKFMLYDTTATMSLPSQPKIQTQPQIQTQTQPQIQTQPQPQIQIQTQTQIQTQPQIQIQTQPQMQSNENAFQPSMNQDVLFWCFYVMQNGAFKYEQLANRFTTEQDGKRDQVLLLRKHIKELKQATGIKITASTIEGEIMCPHISTHAFQVIVHLNSLNAIFVNPHNRVYAEFISDAVSDKPIYMIKRKDEKTKRVCMTKATEAQLASLRETHYRIENLHKPIKSISSYTVADLTEMCHSLKIQIRPKMKKQELYDAISKQLFL